MSELCDWKIDNILMVFRDIIDIGKEEAFYKDLLEYEILAWMPMFPVRGLY